MMRAVVFFSCTVLVCMILASLAEPREAEEVNIYTHEPSAIRSIFSRKDSHIRSGSPFSRIRLS